MFSLILESEKGEQVSLTDNLAYAITDIDGLYPPSANIITSELSLYDGSKFNSSKVTARQMQINGKIQYNAAKNRVALYKVIKTKHFIRVKYADDERDVYIDGYVSDLQMGHFENPQTFSVTILCPEPFFKDAQEIIDQVNTIIKNFHFPFAITAADPIPFGYFDSVLELNVENDGDVATGIVITITATGQVDNPTIFNKETREFFGVQTSLEAGDVLTISTERGSKTVTLLRDGEETNMFNSIEQGSAWIQLEPGDNIFTYEADNDTVQYMSVSFTHRHQYQGV